MSNYVDIPKWFWRCVDKINKNHIKNIAVYTDIDVFRLLRMTNNPDFDFELSLC